MISSANYPRDWVTNLVLLGPLALVSCSLLPCAKPQATTPLQARASNGTTASKKALTAEETKKEMSLNHGFTLLYELMSKESDVDKIFILRNASTPTQAIVREIATVCTNAKERLDELAKENPLLPLDHNDLPTAEIDTREAIEWATTKKLLLGSDFELKLILTQIAATEYAAFLAESLADRDQDKERKAWLMELAKSFKDLHQLVVQRLMVKPKEQP